MFNPVMYENYLNEIKDEVEDEIRVKIKTDKFYKEDIEYMIELFSFLLTLPIESREVVNDNTLQIKR